MLQLDCQRRQPPRFCEPRPPLAKQGKLFLTFHLEAAGQLHQYQKHQVLVLLAD